MITIDKVILIHPEQFVDRLRNLEKVYPSCLPEYEIPTALTGDDVTPPDWWLASKNAYALLENVKSIVSSLDSVTLVLEDDVRFSDDFAEMLSNCLAEIPNDWDLVYLKGKHKYNKLHKPVRVSKYCLKARNITGTPAVIYNPDSKDKLLSILDETTWLPDYSKAHEYDYAYANAMMRNRINVYTPIKNICGQHTEPSTLRDNPGRPSPTFNNDFDYIDLDGSIKRMTEETVIG